MESPSAQGHCPRCYLLLESTYARCPECGLSLRDVALYNPKHFKVLAVFFGVLVPIHIAARNWKRVGQDSLATRWRWGGFFGFTVLVTLLALIPDSLDALARLLGVFVSFSIGWFLSDRQKSLYAGGRSVGASKAAWGGGLLQGLGLTALAVAVPVVVVLGFVGVVDGQGMELLHEEKCAEAASRLQLALDVGGEDEFIRLHLAMAAICQEEWEPARANLEKFRALHDDDARVHALLGLVHQEQGEHERANEHFDRALELDPGILRHLFGE